MVRAVVVSGVAVALALALEAPPAAASPWCRMRTEIEADFRGSKVHLRFFLESTVATTATVTLVGRCSGGLVRLEGLPEGFDPMHTCLAKPCEVERRTVVVRPGKRGRVAIGETTLSAKGDACNPPLPVGGSFLRAYANDEDRSTALCGGAPVAVLRDAKRTTLRRGTPPKAQREFHRVLHPKKCPVCAIGCPNGLPSARIGPDGCRVCACEDLGSELVPEPR